MPFLLPQVYCQPTGMVSVTGLAVEGSFFGQLLDRWSIKRHFIKREEFKGAVERFTEEKFTAPARLAMDRLLSSMINSVVEARQQQPSFHARKAAEQIRKTERRASQKNSSLGRRASLRTGCC